MITKRPRNDELAFVLREMRRQAASNRTQAERNQERAEIETDERFRALFLSMAKRKAIHAGRFERVIAWIEAL